MHPAYVGELPEGWQGGAPVTKYWNGNYIHLYRLTRPCATCSAEISIDVTKNAIDGTKKNAGLLLRNCPKCRAERKAGGVGSRGGKSRPIAGEPAAAPTPVNNEELETLRAVCATMKEELEGLYVLNKELRQQLAQSTTPDLAVKTPDTVRAYKMPEDQSLGAAVKASVKAAEAIKAPDPTGDTLLQNFLNSKPKMPWNGG